MFYAFWSASGGIRYDYHSVTKTTDGGFTWNALPYSRVLDSISQEYTLNQPAILDSLHWIFPITYGTLLLSLRTSDGGNTWENINAAPSGWQTTHGAVLQIHATSGGNLYLGFPGATTPILYSSDFGSSWLAPHSDPNSYSPIIAPISKDTMWVIGYSRSSDNYGVWGTTNFGGNWHEDTSSFFGVPLNDIHFLNSRYGWILGDSTQPGLPFYTGSAYVYIYQPERLSVPASEHTTSLAIICYPNPVTSHLAVSGLSAGPNHPFRIYDELGRELKSGKLASDGTVDISNLIQGNYRIEIPGEGSCSFIKLR